MSKNRSYQIYELRDEIKKALSNLDLVEEQERKLSIVLTNSQFVDEFKDFLTGLKSNKNDYANQRANLNTRLEKLNELIKLREDRENNGELVDKIITLVLEGIGATKPEKNKPQA